MTDIEPELLLRGLHFLFCPQGSTTNETSGVKARLHVVPSTRRISSVIRDIMELVTTHLQSRVTSQDLARLSGAWVRCVCSEIPEQAYINPFGYSLVSAISNNEKPFLMTSAISRMLQVCFPLWDPRLKQLDTMIVVASHADRQRLSVSDNLGIPRLGECAARSRINSASASMSGARLRDCPALTLQRVP